MTEEEIIKRTGQKPVTVHSLIADLRALGLRPGSTIIVHSSLSALGWVSGGPVAVVLALEAVLTPTGTLVMPTHTGGLSDPAEWQHPPVPAAWWPVIRETMPAFDPGITPSRGMGAIPECFRTQADTQRSQHPQYSFAAKGKHASTIVENHALEFGLGERSPLARIYELGGWVLLLGVGHDSNTSLHLAEYRANYSSKKLVSCGTSMQINGTRQWVTFQDIELNSDDFHLIGADFEKSSHKVIAGQVGLASVRLMPQRELVDFGATWLEQNRR
jgi:aminoglycoside 3-N-acetyltransferase